MPVTSDDLTDKQRRVLSDYLDALAVTARATAEPQEEAVERDGIRWQARVRANGTIQTLVLEKLD
jgi:hypothetical protein